MKFILIKDDLWSSKELCIFKNIMNNRRNSSFVIFGFFLQNLRPMKSKSSVTIVSEGFASKNGLNLSVNTIRAPSIVSMRFLFLSKWSIGAILSNTARFSDSPTQEVYRSLWIAKTLAKFMKQWKLARLSRLTLISLSWALLMSSRSFFCLFCAFSKI